MNHKILALLLTVILGFTGSSFAQSARESTHIVRPGETLAVIAARYEVDLNDLAALNGIYNYHRIYSWQKLEIPGLSEEEAPIAGEDRSHVIRYGETLSVIAERYGVDLTELKKLNDLYGKVIYPGQELLLPSPAGSGATIPNEPLVTTQSRQHIVRHGETLGTIAAAYGVNLNELILVNGIFGHIIYPGQALTLPDADGRTLVNSATGAPVAETSPPITLGSRLFYVVRAGDTLGDLARHFGITWPAIMRANNIVYPYHIYVGQQLWIPSTGSAALNVADVEPAPVPDPPTETVAAETTESPAETSEPAPGLPPPGDYFEHTIQHGETLGILAIRYGVTFQDLIAVNNIVYPYHIYVGQQLWIPSTGSAALNVADVEPAPVPDPPTETSAAETTESPAETSEPAPGLPPPGDYFEHTIQHGETLGILAIRYGVTFQDLIAVNNIVYPYHIYVGQQLWIPSTGSAALNVADVEPAPVPDSPTETSAAETTESPAETSEPAPGLPPPGDYFEHTIQHGETLGILAIRYGVTFQDLIAANNIVYPYHIYVGQQLWIPSTGSAALNAADVEPAPVPDSPTETVAAETTESPAETSEPAPGLPPPGDYFEHTIQHGETLGILAIRYGVTFQDLIAVNNIVYPYHIYVGQQLWIPSTGSAALNAADVEPASVPDSPTETVAVVTTESPAETSAPAAEPSQPITLGSRLFYIVRAGDTLGDLARHFGITWPAIMRANDIVYPYHIYVGQQLWIPSTGSPALNVANVEPASVPDSPTETVGAETTESPVETSAPAAEPSQPIKLGSQLFYIVRAGDTLGDLARHFGITWPAILRANDIVYPYHIYVGQQLWIPSTGSPALNVVEVEPAPVPDSPTESPAETSEPAPDGPPPGDYFEHTIQFGETLGILAIYYGVTVQDLIAANNIDDANRIESGQALWIPGSAKRRDPPPPPQLPEPAQEPASEVATAPAAPAPQTQNAPAVAGTRKQYVVRKGDFLTQLAIDLDTSWIALARLNNLESPYVLHVGSTLLIPQRADVELYDPKYAAWKWFDIFAHQPGPRVGVGREIVILLHAQAIYAYENGVLQKAVRVSTGKKATPTVKGDHKIWLKRRSQTMSGEDYSLDNVEWVMYFYRDYAIHGTWWHTNFGQPMSHGCVNLTNTDAQWFYEFASIGTPVHVR